MLEVNSEEVRHHISQDDFIHRYTIKHVLRRLVRKVYSLGRENKPQNASKNSFKSNFIQFHKDLQHNKWNELKVMRAENNETEEERTHK